MSLCVDIVLIGIYLHLFYLFKFCKFYARIRHIHFECNDTDKLNILILTRMIIHFYKY